MTKPNNWVQLTNQDRVKAKCIVIRGNKRKTFDKFVVVGFEEDGDYCTTAAELVELGRALLLLRETYNRAMMQADPDLKREIEAALAIEQSYGEDED